MTDTPCQFCDEPFDQALLGLHGCPNCRGEGLDDDGTSALKAEIDVLKADVKVLRTAREQLISSHAARGKEIEHLKNIGHLKDADKTALAAMLRVWIEAADPLGHQDLIARTNEVLKRNARGIK